MSIPIKQIAKFIHELYKPAQMSYDLRDNPDGPPEHIIHIYFNEIDDKYLTNPEARDPVENMEKNLETEIRTYIKDFFGIETTGLTLSRFWAPTAPWVKHALTINVICKIS